MTAESRHGGRRLARNAAFNALGQVLPLLLAIPILPYVLATLGAERFAVLTLAWTIIGYFGFLDLGLGRASTKYIAGALADGRSDEVSRIVWSSATLQLVLGTAGAGIIMLLASVLATDVLRIDDPLLRAETGRTFAVIAAGLPLVLLSGTFSGVLEAHQRFDLVNAVRVPGNVATLVIPALGAAAGASLPVIVAWIVVARALALLGFWTLAVRLSERLPLRRPHAGTLRMLLGFGGWLSVSLLAVPAFTYAERLILGGLRSLTELAYYAVPFEIVARSAILPAAVAFTLFPAFSSALGDRSAIQRLFRKPVQLLFVAQWPLLVVFWLFPEELMTAWMNAEVAQAGAPALRLLALAFFLNGFAQVALAGVQGLGRPDLKAKLDLVQLPAYLLVAVLLISRFGISGAAAAKLLVTGADTLLLFVFARRLGAPPLLNREWLRAHPVVVCMIVACVAGAALTVSASLPVRVATAATVVCALVAVFWRSVLEPNDRAAFLGLVGCAR
jgi:O-antigen/teichoic acid export membrane protein